ncbi:MAG TPA: hypothetical protein VHG09_15170, partial [Longimicrobiales bacterium]|nr:hypothetical protein [Longimicrobiales bacterium]
RDPVKDLQTRLEAAIDEVRPKIRKALDELDARVDEAVADLRPRAQNAMNEVRPKVDQFVADVQPRLDSLLDRLQQRIEELRRDLDSRASRTNTPAGEITAGASAGTAQDAASGYGAAGAPGGEGMTEPDSTRGPGADESIP